MQNDTQTTTIATLPEQKTLNGKFDAYCRVCWNPVYAFWVSDEDHGGKCHSGHNRAQDCPDAMGRAQLTATIAHLKADGLL